MMNMAETDKVEFLLQQKRHLSLFSQANQEHNMDIKTDGIIKMFIVTLVRVKLVTCNCTNP